MNRSILLSLLQKYRQGLCTAEEQQLLFRWLDLLEQHAEARQSLTDEEKQLLQASMMQNILPVTARSARRRILHSPWLRVAAILALLAGITYLLRPLLYPSRPVAWLTQRNTTAQVQRLLLPDSTEVLLAIHTTIQYSAQYNAPTREVKLLEGKALFNTHTDPQHPFIVQSRNVRTRVLGTSFSVAAYKGWYACRITVMSGKVQVQQNATDYGVLLPAQRITLPETGDKYLRDSIAVADALAWTQGAIILRNANLQELMHMLREQYGITTTTSLDVLQGSYTLRLQAAMPLQAILDVIEKISYKPKIRFRMQQNQLVIY